MILFRYPDTGTTVIILKYVAVLDKEYINNLLGIYWYLLMMVVVLFLLAWSCEIMVTARITICSKHGEIDRFARRTNSRPRVRACPDYTINPLTQDDVAR